MAITGLGKAAPQAGNGVNENTSTVGVEAPTTGTQIGWGTRDLFVMNSNMGSEYTQKFAKTMTEALLKAPNNIKPKINILDKEICEGLAYSSIVMSHKTNDVVYYFIALLAGTGREAMKASEIMSELSVQRVPGQKPNIFTIDDGIDSVLHDEVLRSLAGEYGQVKFVSGDGVIVPGHESETIAINVAAIGYNAVTIDPVIVSGDYQDLNIYEAIKATPNRSLKLETNLTTQVSKDEVERPVRHDFSVDLVSVDNTNSTGSINLANSRETLSKVTGFIDSIPVDVQIPTMPGMPVVVNTRLHPHIVLTSTSVKLPTPGFTMMSLLSGLVMTQENMYLPALMPSAKGQLNDVGVLNTITNVDNNTDGNGTIIDFTAKGVDREKAFDFLKRMYTEAPIVSMDIETFGPQTYYTSLFGVGAQSTATAAKSAALKEIVVTCANLTNGNFPVDFPVDKIFAQAGVVVPTGVWHDKTGERDIRDIDLSFIAGRTQDPILINRWALSNFPRNVTGEDPFTTKVEIINALIPEAEIASKAIRVTFTTEFITTLVNAATAAGFNARYEAQISFTQANDLSAVSTYLQHAGVSNAAAYATQSMATGPSYNTGYGNIGYNRF